MLGSFVPGSAAGGTSGSSLSHRNPKPKTAGTIQRKTKTPKNGHHRQLPGSMTRGTPSVPSVFLGLAQKAQA